MSALQYDMVIVGAGIAGLWLGNVLKRAGYNIILLERDKIGSGQTLASQGMIHGGQKYALTGQVQGHAIDISAMPARWEACFDGYGDIDLTAVTSISETQIMWPAGSVLSTAAVLAAARLVNAKTRKLKKSEYPEALTEIRGFKGAVYELPEKVLDVRSLLQALTRNLKGRIFRAAVTEVLPDGQVAAGGLAMKGQLVIFTGGAGNEEAFRMMNLSAERTQRRPLRQMIVQTLPYPLYGHGIVGHPKPRVTVTAYRKHEGNGYIWYLGGGIAETAAHLGEAEAIAFARREMAEMFPAIDWQTKEWATWHGDRAEPRDEHGHLPAGPHVEQRGRVLIGWPVKLTFAPVLADKVMTWMADKDMRPRFKTDGPDLPMADIGAYPWETALWQR